MMMMVPMMMPNTMMQANGQGFVQGATMMGNQIQQQATQVQTNNIGAQSHQQMQMQQQATQQFASSNTHNGMNMMLTNPMGAFQGMHSMQNTFPQQNSNAAQVPVSTMAPRAHQQQQQTSTQQQSNMSSSNHSASGGNDQNVGNGDGSLTYGGNLAHCA